MTFWHLEHHKNHAETDFAGQLGCHIEQQIEAPYHNTETYAVGFWTN